MAVKHVESKLAPQAYRKKHLKGWKLLGYGAFARIYIKSPKAIEVIKFGEEADAYMHYVNQVGILNPCIHVPRIFDIQRFFHIEKSIGWDGRPADYKHKYYAVRMERLVKYYDISHKQRCAAFKRAGVEDLWSLVNPSDYKIVSPHTKPFKQIMQRTFKNHGHDIDLHDANVMFRHRVHGVHDVYDLVVTDPLC